MTRPNNVPAEAQSGILAKGAARRLGVPELAGQTVWYTLLKSDVKMAQDVWDNDGYRLGGIVSELCRDWFGPQAR